MPRLCLLILLCCVLPVAAWAQAAPSPVKFDKRQFVISSGVYWAGVTADAVSTEQGLRRGLVERNPLLQGATQRRVIYWSVAGGVYVLTVWLEKKHPRAARAMRYLGGGIHAGAAAYNWSQVKGQTSNVGIDLRP